MWRPTSPGYRVGPCSTRRWRVSVIGSCGPRWPSGGERRKVPELTEALDGRSSAHHAFMVQVHQNLIDGHTPENRRIAVGLYRIAILANCWTTSARMRWAVRTTIRSQFTLELRGVARKDERRSRSASGNEQGRRVGTGLGWHEVHYVVARRVGRHEGLTRRLEWD